MIVIVTVLWCTFASMKKVLLTSQKLRYTEFEIVKIAADSVKFYCRLLVKLDLRDSKLIKLNCVQYKFLQRAAMREQVLY